MEQVPPLKSSGYYRLVDLIARARLARARLSKPPGPQSGLRILCYHRISYDHDVLAVRPDDFRRQLEMVRASGWEVVRIGEALGRLPDGGRYLSITFDDGYRDNLTEALPILQEFGMPATLFAPSNVVSGDPDFYWYRSQPPPALTPDELGELVAEGTFDVQSHTRRHPALPRLSDDDARREIAQSRIEIESSLGVSVSGLSYPAGLCGPREFALARAAGYAYAVTTAAGITTAESDPMLLRRTLIGPADDDLGFRAKLDGLLDRPSSLTALAQRIRARR